MKTIMAMYTGNEPQTGRSNQPFYFGEVPVVQSPVQAAKQAIELSREPLLHDYVIRTSGGFFVTPQFAVGIMPGTSFVLTALKDSVADPLLAGVEGYMVKEIDYETYRRVLVQASNEADVKACMFGDAVEHAYLRFFGIDISKLKPTDQFQVVARADRIYLVEKPGGYTGAFELDWIVPAIALERLLAASAMIQDLTKELKINAYEITIFLHSEETEKPAIIYSYEAKTNSDKSSDS